MGRSRRMSWSEVAKFATSLGMLSTMPSRVSARAISTSRPSSSIWAGSPRVDLVFVQSPPQTVTHQRSRYLHLHHLPLRSLSSFSKHRAMTGACREHQANLVGKLCIERRGFARWGTRWRCIVAIWTQRAWCQTREIGWEQASDDNLW